MNRTVDGFGLRRHDPPAGIPVRDEWVLCIHGMWEAGGIYDGVWEDEEDVFPPFIDPFREAGYRCAVLLLPGYCRKFPVENRGKVSFYTYLPWVLRAYKELNNPILIGHSLGGLLAQKLMEEVTPPAAVLLAPAAPEDIGALHGKELWRFAAKYAVPILGQLPLLPSKTDMNRLMLNCLPADDREKLYPELQSASGLQAREISMPWVQGIPVKVNPGAVPVCVAFGTEDKITPPVIAEGVAAKYSAKQLPYSGRGHMLTIEPGWENVARDVLAWLEGATSRRGNRTGSN